MKISTKVALALAAVGSPLTFWALVVLGMFAVAASGGQDTAAPAGCYAPAVAADEDETSPLGLDAEQVANVNVIIAEGKARGLPPYAWVIAIATARQESTLHNLDHGLGSSLGLFQLIAANGTAEQRMDPLFSTGWFYDGLVKVPGWELLPVTVAAQDVQHSGSPLAYAQWEALARQAVATYGDGAQAAGGTPCGVPLTGTECPVHPRSNEAGLVTDAVRLQRCMLATFGADPLLGGVGGFATSGHVPGSDHYTGRALDMGVRDYGTPAGRALGDAMADFAIVNAQAFGVKYVIWNARIYDFRQPVLGWRPYRHPCGCDDPNLQHLNHVHVSVYGLPQGAPA